MSWSSRFAWENCSAPATSVRVNRPAGLGVGDVSLVTVTCTCGNATLGSRLSRMVSRPRISSLNSRPPHVEWNSSTLEFVTLRIWKLLDAQDRKSTRLNSSHRCSSYAVCCLKKKKQREKQVKKNKVEISLF